LNLSVTERANDEEAMWFSQSALMGQGKRSGRHCESRGESADACE